MTLIFSLSLQALLTTLFFFSLSLSLAGGVYLDGTCHREIEAGTVFQVTGAYDPASLNKDRCKESCSELALEDPEITIAGLTQGKICLCGRDPGNDNILLLGL